MAGNNIPVLKLDIDEENIRRLDEISEKFKAAFTIGPGGFPVNNPPPEKKIPGNNNVPQQPKNVPAPTDTGRPRDENGRYLPQGGGSGNPDKGKKPDEDGGGKFLGSLKKFLEEDEKAFTQVSKTLKQVNNQLTSLFKNTISWGVRLSLLSGGGLFGYDMFAAHAAKQYTTSQGLNMTTGQMQAAKNVYGTRFAGNDAIMNALARAQSDGTSQEAKALYGMGINPTDGAAANLPKVYSKAAEIIAGMKGTGLSQAALNARGLGSLGFDTQTANQTKANADQLPRLANQYEGTAKSLDMSAGTQRSWQDITTTFDNNLDHITNTLRTKLATLNGPMGKLSTELTNSIDAFISGPNGTEVFTFISNGLTSLANWIGSPKFQTDMTTFADDVAHLCRQIKRGLEFLHLLPSSTDEDREASPEEKKDLKNSVPMGVSTTWGDNTAGYAQQSLAYFLHKTKSPLLNSMAGTFKQIESQHHLPTGMLQRIAYMESGGNRYNVSDAGAAGLFQFLPGTGHAYGLKAASDFFDPLKSSNAAGQYFDDNMRRYHGDIAKALAQYNGGNKAVEKDGSLNLSVETVNYLRRALPYIQGAEQQHPGLMKTLDAAAHYLNMRPKDTRVHLQFDLQQTPGADVGLSVKSQGIRLPANAFVIPG
ncbi:lytic transglycosylase domain-containing protein [Serratia quinivorans]|uniref:lytic transglycosylase domain-containing protein n=1 Tax=Serratia quinivorans TaxID=137545 RepID=UPI0021B77499|nr:lytic transglycosylase domain-containing protein [Serratia quinivorans]